MSATRSSYFETLGWTIESARVRATEDGAVIDNAEWARICDNVNALNYGDTLTLSCPLVSLKQKPTKKRLQISIYRMDSGRYELTQYFL